MYLPYKEKLWWKIFRNQVIKNQIFKFLRIYGNIYKYTRFRSFKAIKNQDFQSTLPYREYITFLRIDFKIDFTFVFPPNLEVLVFGDSFDGEIPLASLPVTLQRLTFGDSFNKPLTELLLKPLINLKYLSIGKNYSHCLNYFPKGLKKIEIKSLRLSKQQQQQQPPSNTNSLFRIQNKNNNSNQSLSLTSSRGSSCSSGGASSSHIIDSNSEDNTENEKYSESEDINDNSSNSSSYFNVGGGTNKKIIEKDYQNQMNNDGDIEEQQQDDDDDDDDDDDYDDESSDSSIDYNFDIKRLNLINNQDSDNDLILPGVLPESLESLIISNFRLVKNSLPSSLQSLTFVGYNQPILPGILPEGLVELNLGTSFNQKLYPFSLPSTLEELTFGENYNSEIDETNVIPISLKSLTLGPFFSPSNFQFLDTLECLKKLVILNPDCCINGATIKIPSTVEELFCNFRDKILVPGDLPSSIESLYFLENFNQKLSPNVIPSSVKTLTFGDSFDRKLKQGDIPSSVTSLTFNGVYNRSFSANESLPSSLKSLTLSFFFNKIIKEDELPEGLEELTFGDLYNKPLGSGSLPSSLQTLTFGKHFNKPIDSTTFEKNKKLTHLQFGDKFNQPILPNSIPESVVNLKFGKKFNQPLPYNTLPIKLKRLKLGKYFNQPIENIQSITKCHSLLCIKFGAHYTQSIRDFIKSLDNSKKIYKLCFQNLSEGINEFSNFKDEIQNNVNTIKISEGFLGNDLSSIPYSIQNLIIPDNYNLNNLDYYLISNIYLKWSVSLLNYFKYLKK